ncbi:MAG: C39 family peptidase, partial [Acidobacteriota bacterium]
MAFTTAKEPGITGKSENFLYPEETIDVTFDTAMRTGEPGIRCACEGTGQWKNNKTYQFKPAKVTVNKAYKFVVPKGLRAVSGGLRSKDAAYAVRTPGPVRAYIAGLGGNANAGAPITVTFDQPVQKTTAQAAFGISPKVSGSFAWPDATTMVFTPRGYEQQTTYVTSMQPGVAPVRFGLPGGVRVAMQFTTEPKTVKLNIPVLAQQHPSSCEAASLRMALAFRGVRDADASIVRKMGYNGRHKNHAKNAWDDPTQMYVGDINGSQSQYQGYGAYAAPIANAARAYGRNASAHYGASAGFVARQIYAGNPVIIIGTVSHMTPIPISW